MSDESSRPGPGRRRPARHGGLDATAGYRGTTRVLLALGAATAAAVCWSMVVRGLWPISGPDTMLYFYPSMQYLADSLLHGSGVFWTRLQNCGQPVFANGQIGALYPPNVVFLLLPGPAALAATETLHFCLGPLGMLYLGRQLRLHPAAALTGALAFMTGDNLWGLGYWQPTAFAPFVWIPWALGATERTLRVPRYGSVMTLAAVLTLQLLASYPQTSLLTYEAIALRALWALLAARGAPPWRGVGAVAIGALLPVGLAAVKLLPGIEFSRLSISGAGLSRTDVLGGVFYQTWKQFRDQLPQLSSNSFVVAAWGLGLVGLALADRRRRRVAVFYFAAAMLFVLLSFDNVLLDLYMRLPFGTMFRLPVRFRWIASVLAAVLIAIGTQVFMRAVERGGRRAAAAVGAVVLGIVVMTWLGHVPPRLLGLGGLYGALVTVDAQKRGVRWWRWCVPAGVAATLLIPATFALRIAFTATGDPPSVQTLSARAAEFERVRSTLTLQDRAYVFEDLRRGRNSSVMEKSSSLFGVPGVSDYEPQTSLRFANFLHALRGQRPDSGFNRFESAPRTPRQRNLLNLVAARYLINDTDDPIRLDLMAPRMRDVARDGAFTIFENPAALPRAFFVPAAEVVANPWALLGRLAMPDHNPQLVALVEAMPADGFLGAEPPATGKAVISADRSETVTIQVEASAPGFLFLSDQDYPGWEATVNGVPVPILRANYAFRLVRVPAGESTVVFHYRPQSVRLGAMISAMTLLGMCAVPLVRGARRRWWAPATVVPSDPRWPTPVPGTATAFLTAGRARWLAMVGAPVLLSAVAFHDIVRVALHHDDYLHLYDIVNLGPGLFTLTNFGGHLQYTRNAVLVALYAAFGLQAQWSMTVVGLTHLLNVALLASVVRHLTRNWAVALVAAAWWGANAMNMEALGWLSVYGQVLSVTAVLWVVRLVAATAGGAPLQRAAPLRALLALLAAATSFGTGVAMTLAMPATAWCLSPPGRARTRLVRAATIAAVVTVALYFASDELNRRLFGAPPATVFLPLLPQYAGAAAKFLVDLLTSGIAIALLGPFFLPLHEASTWSTALACGAAGAILLAGRPAWRPVLGCALLSLASYGMIALARFPIALGLVPDAALRGRYHYAAPLGFLLMLALAVAAGLDRLPARWPVRTRLAVVGYGAAVIGYLFFFPPVPRWDVVQRDVNTALAGVEAAVKRNPPGADVYLPHQPFFISDLTTIRIGDHEMSGPVVRFPGVAGLFALSQPSNVVDGHRVFFVVDDPAKLDAWQRGRRGAGLILSEEEMRARGGSLTE